jgi:hypothetical protein
MSHRGEGEAKISETCRRRGIKIRKSSYEPLPAGGLGVLDPRDQNLVRAGHTPPRTWRAAQFLLATGSLSGAQTGDL